MPRYTNSIYSEIDKGINNYLFIFLSQARSSSPKIEDEHSLLQCTKCHTVLGQVDVATGGFRLRKLNLSVSTQPDRQAMSYHEQKWFACLLLCAMNAKGVRKFHVHTGNNILKLWLFSPDLTISSSASASAQPVRVVKVLWQDIETIDRSGPERLTSASLSEDDLPLLHNEVQSLRRVLEASAQLLSFGARTFQEWNVGLLERFIATDVESS